MLNIFLLLIKESEDWMNREIKFKGKSLKTGEWLYGDLIQDIPNKRCAIVPQKRVWQVVKYEVIPESVGEYTGLKDKNRKEIYEGDIVKEGDANFMEPVIFENGAYKWGEDHFLGYDSYGDFTDTTFWATVVGNIYENPELLKEGK